MRDKLGEYKAIFYKRNGKDCNIWFELRDYYNEVIFKSSVHKVSLSSYRMISMKYNLRNQGIYI